MPEHPSSRDAAQPSVPSPTVGGVPAPAPSAEPAHPADAAHDLSDSPIHARSPDDYTEAPGSHRRTADGPALDVGG
jgi:hypothetical protein